MGDAAIVDLGQHPGSVAVDERLLPGRPEVVVGVHPVSPAHVEEIDLRIDRVAIPALGAQVVEASDRELDQEARADSTQGRRDDDPEPIE